MILLKVIWKIKKVRDKKVFFNKSQDPILMIKTLVIIQIMKKKKILEYYLFFKLLNIINIKCINIFFYCFKNL